MKIHALGMNVCEGGAELGATRRVLLITTWETSQRCVKMKSTPWAGSALGGVALSHVSPHHVSYGTDSLDRWV